MSHDWSFALASAAGRITKTFIIRCCTCTGWYQCTNKRTRGSFIKHARAIGWVRCRIGGWKCRNCYAQSKKKRSDAAGLKKKGQP